MKRTESKITDLTKLTEQFYTFKIWFLQIMALQVIIFEAGIWTQINRTNISVESTSLCIVAFQNSSDCLGPCKYLKFYNGLFYKPLGGFEESDLF